MSIFEENNLRVSYNVPGTSAAVTESISTNTPTLDSESVSVTENETESEDDGIMQLIQSDIIMNMNETIIPLLNVSPIKKTGNESYFQTKPDKISGIIKRALTSSTTDNSGIKNDSRYYTEIITNIRDMFHITTHYTLKIQLLSLLPQSMKVAEIQEILGSTATRYMIEKAKRSNQTKQLQPQLIIEKSLRSHSQHIKQAVLEFYNDDDISRLLPGKNDSIMVHIDGERKN